MSTNSLAFDRYSASGRSADGCFGAGAFGVGLVAGRVRAALQAWTGRAERRRAALSLNDRTLADIGLDRHQVALEAAKPFWRP